VDVSGIYSDGEAPSSGNEPVGQFVAEGSNIGETISDSGSFDSGSGMSDVSLCRESDYRYKATSVAGTDETELSSIVERMSDL
jgi:hypothetical protein